MANFNYRWHRSRFKIPELDELPPGRWLSVRLAAEQLNKSTQTIHTWYLTGKLSACRHGKKGLILVDILSKK